MLNYKNKKIKLPKGRSLVKKRQRFDLKVEIQPRNDRGQMSKVGKEGEVRITWQVEPKCRSPRQIFEKGSQVGRQYGNQD